CLNLAHRRRGDQVCGCLVMGEAVACAAAAGRRGEDVRVRRSSRLYLRRIFEIGGTRSGAEAHMMPFPLAAWHALAWISELLPKPAITRNQIELMQIDTIASPERPGLAELGISRHSVEEILQQIMSEH